MNSFADLVNSGVIHDDTSNYYACKRLSIDEITNKEITILLLLFKKNSTMANFYFLRLFFVLEFYFSTIICIFVL